MRPADRPRAWLARDRRRRRAAGAAPADAERGHVRLDGVDVRLRDGTPRSSPSTAPAATTPGSPCGCSRDGRWQQRMQATDGRIGYGGLVAGPRRQQGTGTTPLGTYDLPWAFGMHAPRRRRGTSRYRKIRRGDFWVQDNALALLQPLPQPEPGRVPLVAARRATRTPPSGSPTTARSTSGRSSSSFNQRPGAPPRLRDLPARQRLRRHRRLRQRAALVHQVADGPARPGPAAR